MKLVGGNMLKPFLKAATVIIALSFISCTPQDNSIQADPISINVNDEITGTSTVTNVSDPIAVEGGNQEISIKGLESGKLFTIYSSKASAGSQSALSAVSGKSRISLNNISGGTYTFILPEGQSEITFTAVEIGLQNGGMVPREWSSDRGKPLPSSQITELNTTKHSTPSMLIPFRILQEWLSTKQQAMAAMQKRAIISRLSMKTEKESKEKRMRFSISRDMKLSTCTSH